MRLERSGQAVITQRRSTVAPDIPFVAELGFAEFDVSSWQGLVVPAGTPQKIVSLLRREVAKVLSLPGDKEKLSQLVRSPRRIRRKNFAITSQRRLRDGKLSLAARA
jgi:tripartite-type tricarboxylate transporter receptor subunit TctC